MTTHFFSQTLKTQQSPESILVCLQSLHHVVYLHNNGQPFITFNADQFQMITHGRTNVFEAASFNSYKQSHSKFDIEFHQKSSNQQTNLQNAYVGFVSYDYAAAQSISCKQKNQPTLFLGYFNHFIRLVNDTWFFESTASNAKQVFEHLEQLLKQATDQPQLALENTCTARWHKAEYTAAFQRVQDYIVAGDCYQINLTQEFKAKAKGSLLATAADFWSLTNAPYSGYLRVEDLELLSCSPELFIEFDTNKNMLTKPIKGTMPRYDDAVLDERSKQALINSEKDQAENLMIVDLLRNDLSVFAETGSVKTTKLFDIESFNQVHHMVSQIEAKLKAEVNPFDVLMTALPGGSITGAPKIRAMQIIEELEQAPRGAYCGSMGYFNEDGSGSWNILIRTIQKYQDDISIWAGGGITIASDCDAEYQECFDKVEAMLDLLNTWYKAE